MSIFNKLGQALHKFNDRIRVATDNINRWKAILNDPNRELTPEEIAGLKHNIDIAIHNLEGAYKGLAIDPSGIIDSLTDGIAGDVG